MNIKLLPFKPEFLEYSMRWRSQPSTLAHNPVKKISKKELLKRHQTEGANLRKLGKHEKFRWFVKFDDRIVGMVSLRSIDLRTFTAEVGYGIEEEE